MRTVEVPGAVSLAQLHQVLLACFGWSGEALHVFDIRGRSYSTSGYVDAERSKGCDDRVVGFAVGERFCWRYDFCSDWIIDARVEAAADVNAVRAGPSEWVRGPDRFAEWEDAHSMFEVMDIVGEVIDAGPVVGPGMLRDRLWPLAEWLGRDVFDGPRLRVQCWMLAGVRNSGGSVMQLVVQVRIHTDTDTGDEGVGELIEIATIHRDGPLTSSTVGMSIEEAKQILAGIDDVVVTSQTSRAVAAAGDCADCGRGFASKDARQIVMRSLYGTHHVESPRWWTCPCAVTGPPSARSARCWSADQHRNWRWWRRNLLLTSRIRPLPVCSKSCFRPVGGSIATRSAAPSHTSPNGWTANSTTTSSTT